MRGEGLQNQQEHLEILTKYVAVQPTAVSENYSSSGMLTIKILLIFAWYADYKKKMKWADVYGHRLYDQIAKRDVMWHHFEVLQYSAYCYLAIFNGHVYYNFNWITMIVIQSGQNIKVSHDNNFPLWNSNVIKVLSSTPRIKVGNFRQGWRTVR